VIYHAELFEEMIKNKNWLFAALIGLGIFGSGLWLGNRLLYALGERELYLAAQENDYCQDEACDEGIASLIAMLERETGIAAEHIPWCMAANVVHTVQFIALDHIKEKFANWMYQSCGNDDITIEDAVLSIGEPED